MVLLPVRFNNDNIAIGYNCHITIYIKTAHPFVIFIYNYIE